MLAVKVLNADSSSDPRKVETFNEEAQKIAELKGCEQIVEVFNAGMKTQDGSQLYYYVMERWGRSLLDLFKEDRTFTLEDIVRIIGRCCDGLKYVGSKKILHTDIHPGNILVTDTLEAKLSDFGMMLLEPEEIVRQASVASCLSMKSRSKVVNRYTALEIIKGGRKAATMLSDMYSLGYVGFDLLDRLDPKNENEELKTYLRRVFTKASAPYKEDRFSDFDAFKDAMENPDESKLLYTTKSEPSQKKGLSIIGMIASVVVGLGMVAGGAYLLKRSPSSAYSGQDSYSTSAEYDDVSDVAEDSGEGSPDIAPDAGPDLDDADAPLPDAPIVTDASAPRLVTRIFCADGKIKMGRVILTADDMISPYLHPIPRSEDSPDNDIRDYLWIEPGSCMDDSHNVATAADLAEVRRIVRARGRIPEGEDRYTGFPRPEDKDLVPFVRCERSPSGVLRAYLDLEKLNLDDFNYIIHRTEPLEPGTQGGGFLFITLGQCLNPRSASGSDAGALTIPPDFCPTGNNYSKNNAGHRIRCCNWNGREVCTDLGLDPASSQTGTHDAGPVDAGRDASTRDARRRDAGTGYHPLAIMQDNPLIIPASQRERIDGGYGFRDLGDVYAILTCNSDGTRFLTLDDQFWNRTHPNFRTESDFRIAIEAGWNIDVENPENCPEFADVIRNTPRSRGAL